MREARRWVVFVLVLGSIAGCGAKPKAPATGPSRTGARVGRSGVSPGGQSASLAWARADRTHTRDAYAAFVAAHPGDPHCAEARHKIANLDWNTASEDGSPAAYRKFATHHPGDPRDAEAWEKVRGEKVDLADARKRGWVHAHVTSQDMSDVHVSLRRTTSKHLRVTIEAGTYFVCRGSAQNMVACNGVTVDLNDNKTHSVSLDAACANLHREEPQGRDSYSVRGSKPGSELDRLAKAIADTSPSEPARQLAIWAVTDNPSRGEVADALMIPPTEDDYKDAAHLLQQAKIDPASKRMFH